MRIFQYDIFADYHQFYIQDDDQSKGDLSESWTEEATGRLLADAPHVIGIGTVRNMTVPVFVSIHEERPELIESDWDHIVEASLRIDTGRIVLAGCTDYFPDATRIDVSPGTYQAIVCFQNLADISDDGLDGEDSYHLHLFPGHEVPPTVIKNRSTG